MSAASNRQSDVQQHDIKYDGIVYGKLTVSDVTGQYTLTATFKQIDKRAGTHCNDDFAGHANELTVALVENCAGTYTHLDIGPLTVDNSGTIHGNGVLTLEERAWLDQYGGSTETHWHFYPPPYEPV